MIVWCSTPGEECDVTGLFRARGRRFFTYLVGGVLGLLGVLVVASPASAHAALLRTSPKANDVVASAPADVVLTFSEPVTPVSGKVRILGPDGSRADDGDP